MAVMASPAQLSTISTATSASWRRRCATPAWRTELLPTPLGPKRTVNRDAWRLAAITSVSRARPKNSMASRSESTNGASPLKGEARAAIALTASASRGRSRGACRGRASPAARRERDVVDDPRVAPDEVDQRPLAPLPDVPDAGGGGARRGEPAPVEAEGDVTDLAGMDSEDIELPARRRVPQTGVLVEARRRHDNADRTERNRRYVGRVPPERLLELARPYAPDPRCRVGRRGRESPPNR